MSVTFRFDGQELVYFRHNYNHASTNMRTVEVPIVREFLRNCEAARILEVGNVLSHYGPIWWPVIDVRDRGERVIRQDVMTWEPAGLFDRIISISTLEHIGYGRFADATKPTTPLAIIRRLRSWLAPGGEGLFTVPLRFNAAWDQALALGTLPVGRALYMRRVSSVRENRWEECTLEQALAVQHPDGKPWSVAMAALYVSRRKAADALEVWM